MADDFLKKFPIKLFPDEAMMRRYVALFIEREPDSFAELIRLLSEQADLAKVMGTFFELLRKNEFDNSYS